MCGRISGVCSPSMSIGVLTCCMPYSEKARRSVNRGSCVAACAKMRQYVVLLNWVRGFGAGVPMTWKSRTWKADSAMPAAERA